jgi:hypothetical protein
MKTCWRRDLDAAAFSSPEKRAKHPRLYIPSVEISSLEIDRDAIRRIIDRLSQVSLPIVVPAAAEGRDGTFYELQLGELWADCRLRWWEEIPMCWKTIRKPVAELRRLFAIAKEHLVDASYRRL